MPRYNLHFKTPDVLDQLKDYFVFDRFGDPLESCSENYNELKELLDKYIEYGECITLVIDTDNGTVTVKEV